MSTPERKRVTVYSDGACAPNPGRGGYAAVLMYGDHRKEISGGFRRTTNNRMEIMGAIVALEALKKGPCNVTIHTDSNNLRGYLIGPGLERARKMGEERLRLKKNGDLRVRLLRAVAEHEITALKVLGHSGVVENERCDELAVAARSVKGELPPDEGFETAPVQAGLFNEEAEED